MELEFYSKFEPNNSCGSEKFKQHFTEMDATLPQVFDPCSLPCSLKADLIQLLFVTLMNAQLH